MTKAVFCDIDGTLIDVTKGQTKVTHKVYEALKAAQNAGHYIFLATGRPFTYIDPGLLNLGFDGLVLMNGAVVVIRDKVIFEEPLENSIVKNIVDTCESNEIEYILQGYPKVYLRPEFKLMEKFYSGLEIDISKFERNFNIDDIVKRQMTPRLD